MLIFFAEYLINFTYSVKLPVSHSSSIEIVNSDITFPSAVISSE